MYLCTVCVWFPQAQKNFKGELYRRSQAAQLLSAVERCKATTESLLGRPESQDPLQRRPPKSAAVIITGDFNAAPDVKDESEYASLVYPLVKEHPLRLRSVLNDDLEELIERMKQQQQQQQQQGQQEQQEREQREREQRCSDVQIDGQNQQPGEYGAASSVSTGRGLSKTPLTSARKSKQRTVMAAVAKVMNATAQIFLNTGTSSSRDAAAELSAAPAEDEGNQDDTPPECATLSEGVDESTTSASAEERDGAGSAAEAAAAQVGLGSAFVSPVWTTWKARRKKNKSDEKIVKHCIDYIFYNTPSDGSKEGTDVGLRAVATLPMLSEEEVGDTLLPSPNYPSDHVALAAVLQIIERRQKK